MNFALRRALNDANLPEHEVAAQMGVDPKTVHRWLAGRTPYPRHRKGLARLLGVDQASLWPTASLPPPKSEITPPLVKAAYPHRWAVPRDAWRRLFQSAQREIGILVYAGLFLAEDHGVLRILASKARDGVQVRILLGDPESPHVAERGAEEGVGEAMAAKIRNSLVLYQPLRTVEGIEFRLHNTPLYASIYRADDEILVNTHAYGTAASHAPVLHLIKVEYGDMASIYLDSFERVWKSATAVA